MRKAVIIGAGIAGIATALRLRAKGLEVDIFESNPYPGGKLHAFTQDGYRFDAGPSLFTLPELVTELFRLFGKKPEDHFTYTQKEVVCNYFWEDGVRFSVKSDPDLFIREAAETFRTDPAKIEKYLTRSRNKYNLTSSIFLEKSLHKVSTYLSSDTLKAIARSGVLDIHMSLDAVNRKYLSEPHLVQMFNRYATYNGSSPYKTPGIMSMIPHLELHKGTYFPRGGMHSITMSLYRLALDEGVQFHFNNRVERIRVEKDRATGIETGSEFFPADVVVSNMDIFPTYHKLLPGQSYPRLTLGQERSSSALIFYWGIRHNFPELDLHNIFFSQDYQEEFNQLFNQRSIYQDPTIYVNITSKEEPADAPPGCENWFVMINAPGDYGQEWKNMIHQTREHIIRKINRLLGTDLEKLIETESVLDPVLIEKRTSSYRGALYGAASNSKFAAFLRHPNFSGKIGNLYFCGGSVHPGGGIPLCLLSAKITADLVCRTKQLEKTS